MSTNTSIYRYQCRVACVAYLSPIRRGTVKMAAGKPENDLKLLL